MAQLKKDLVHGSIARNLITFSIPVFLSCFLQALYGNADAIIVGQFSDLANITGVTQGSQVMNIVTQMISGLSVGGTVLVSQFMGARREKDLQETVSTIFSLFIVSALVLTVVMFFGNRALAEILAINEIAIPAFVSYLRICEAGMLFIFLYNSIAAVLQAMGDSKRPLVFVGIASVVNISLDLVLVGGLKMGATGAALATVLAQFVSVVLSIVYLKRHDFIFSFTLKGLRINREKTAVILRLGAPYMVQRFLVYSSFAAISGLANGYGLEAGSAAGIVAKINTFATLPFSAFNVGVATCAAQNIGAGEIDRARKSMFWGVLLCLISGTFFFTLCQLFPRTIISLFSSNEALIEMGIPFLRAYSWEYVLMPFTWSIHGLFSGSGHTIIPSIDGILASVVFRTPLAIFFSRTMGMGFPGIAFGAAMAVWGAIIPAWVCYAIGFWKKPVLKISQTDSKKEEGKRD